MTRRAPVVRSTDLHFNQEDTPMIKSSIFSAAVTTVSAVSLVGAAKAQPVHNTSDGKPVKNVVLVHGAFADGSGWRGVYDELTQRGYRVTIVQIPLTSLADDVAATQRALDRQDGPTILVGHSWGGTVITEAGTHSNVAGLVYVSALSPDAGETTAQQYEGFAPTPEFVIETHEQGFGFLSPEKFKAGFAHDASDADAAFMRDSQVPINMSVFGTKLNNAAWRTKPSWAVIATEDKAFDQAMLLHMAERIGAKITKVSASHAVFMTQPKVVADTINRAARSVSQSANAAHP
jgi:pimeloyl-ACP methyl ester carboxylesterase